MGWHPACQHNRKLSSSLHPLKKMHRQKRLASIIVCCHATIAARPVLALFMISKWCQHCKSTEMYSRARTRIFLYSWAVSKKFVTSTRLMGIIPPKIVVEGSLHLSFWPPLQYLDSDFLQINFKFIFAPNFEDETFEISILRNQSSNFYGFCSS